MQVREAHVERMLGKKVHDVNGDVVGRLEEMIADRARERLAANGLEMRFFSLQQPDLREYGEALRDLPGHA